MLQGYLVYAGGTDAAENLALEAYLLKNCAQTQAAILYFWQNDRTVVIGRNQNAYTECDLIYARANGIRVIRRTTGGGAVYHDLGNQNFSILLPRALYDPSRSAAMVADALCACGVKAACSGRNDICTQGGKISGSAFYSNETVGLHHGTILYRCDHETMSRVLSVSSLKTAAHGVSSVRSRVTDVAALAPEVTLGQIRQAILDAFCRYYDISVLQPLTVPAEHLRESAAQFRSDEWNFDPVREYALAKAARFPWGTVRLSLRMDGPRAVDVSLATDAMDADRAQDVKKILRQCVLHTAPDAVPNAVRRLFDGDDDFAQDVTDLFLQLWTDR